MTTRVSETTVVAVLSFLPPPCSTRQIVVSAAEIASDLGCSRQTVESAIQEAGLWYGVCISKSVDAYDGHKGYHVSDADSFKVIEGLLLTSM